MIRGKILPQELSTMNNNYILEDTKKITPKELSERWGVSVRTLANKRAHGHAPGYFKIGQKVWYSLEEIETIENASYKKPIHA
tara:strand:+ start:764 stop:1012 length:249 start_codon:yes stop_codon:yes gene_type:complete